MAKLTRRPRGLGRPRALRRETTLLELLTALEDCAASDTEAVATLAHLINRSRVSLVRGKARAVR